MITEPIYAQLSILASMLHSECGWSIARCEKATADITNVLTADDKRAEQDRKDVAAAKLLPQGAAIVSARFGCHKSTAYRRAKRGNEIVASSGT